MEWFDCTLLAAEIYPIMHPGRIRKSWFPVPPVAIWHSRSGAIEPSQNKNVSILLGTSSHSTTLVPGDSTILLNVMVS